MSLLASLRLSLDSMGFLQLSLAFAALLAYSLSLGASLSAKARTGASAVSFLAAIGFAAATPQWTAGVVLVAIGVAGFGLFAGSTWLLAHLIGVGRTRGRLAADTSFTPDAPRGPRSRWQDIGPTVAGGLHQPTALTAHST